jgi:hypothetical protein
VSQKESEREEQKVLESGPFFFDSSLFLPPTKFCIIPSNVPSDNGDNDA